MFKKYYSLTKPGIIYGNAMTAIAGFLLASKGHINFSLLIETVLGICLVIGSACVFNNLIDRDIDRVMARTKKRALVKGLIPTTNAILFGVIIGLLGFLILGIWVNKLVVSIGVIAFVDYVIIYGLSKRNSVHGTLVGSISGAAPIVAGYCAVTGQIDVAAVILFIILVAWQMPHFYAIAIFRLKDYKAAKIPVLPVVKGLRHTKYQIIFYTIVFSLAVILLRICGYTGNIYLLIMVIVSAVWLVLGFRGLKTASETKWARQMFFYSLYVILIFSVLISLNPWLK